VAFLDGVEQAQARARAILDAAEWRVPLFLGVLKSLASVAAVAAWVHAETTM
jgi:hypothetical protein